jgi:hypothetical protein
MQQRVLFRALPVLLGAVVGGIAVFTSPHQAPRDFFEITAQILVVLLLTAGLQARLLSARVGRPIPEFPWSAEPLSEYSTQDILDWAKAFADYCVDAISVATSALLAAVVLVVGELAALDVLLGKTTTGNPRLTIACISFGLIALTIAALLAGSQDAEQPGESRPSLEARQPSPEQSHPQPTNDFFAPIKITGKPQPVRERRVGFSYEIPLNRAPEQEWAKHFQRIEWAPAAGISPEDGPKVLVAVIRIPLLANEADYRRLLDAIDLGVTEANRFVSQSRKAKRLAADEAIFNTWWAEREAQS